MLNQINFTEKLAMITEYAANPDKIYKDIQEFMSVLIGLLLLFDGSHDIEIESMDVIDLVDLMLVFKKFSVDVEPFIIEYGIKPYFEEEGVNEWKN